MKIACISTSRVPSDTANSIQVMKACHALARLGHQVHLLVPGIDNTPWADLAERYALTAPFDISWLPSTPRLRRNDFAWLAVREARRQSSSMVYTWTGQSAVFALLPAMRGEKRAAPVVYEVHDLPTGRLGPLWFRWFLRMPGKKRLVLITRALGRALERRFGALHSDSVVIAPNGVDLEQYEGLPEPGAARRSLGLPDLPTVLCAGHLYAGRGVGLFLELAKRFPQASFVWVGGRAEDVAAYREQAAALGIGNILFSGFIDQKRLPCYQAAADVLLMPYAQSIAGSSGGNSAEICSPMKMFDYLAAGRAILTSDLPVIHEVLNETNARFAPPENALVWVDMLAELLANETLRQRLGQQAARDARGYSWRERAERILAGLE